MDDARWEEDFLGWLGQEESEPEEEDREEERQQPVPKLKTSRKQFQHLKMYRASLKIEDTSVKQQQSAQQ